MKREKLRERKRVRERRYFFGEKMKWKEESWGNYEEKIWKKRRFLRKKIPFHKSRERNEKRVEEIRGKMWKKIHFFEKKKMKFTFHCVGTALFSKALNACSRPLVMTIRPLIAEQSVSNDVWITSNKRSNLCTSCSKMTSNVDCLVSSFILALSSFHFLSSCCWSWPLDSCFKPVWKEKSFLMTVTRLGSRERMSSDKSSTMSSLVFLDLWFNV